MLVSSSSLPKNVILWSGVGLPTFAITSFSKEVTSASFSVSCSKLARGDVQNAVIAPDGLNYLHSVSFASLIEFDGDSLSEETFVRRLPLSDLSFSADVQSSHSVSIVSLDGLINVTLNFEKNAGTSKVNPHNHFAAGSTLLDLIIDGFHFNSSHSKLALETVVLTLDQSVRVVF